MFQAAKRLARHPTTEGGPTAAEYAIMLALIAVVCVTALGNLGYPGEQHVQSRMQRIEGVGPLNPRP
ncbi:MAG TPA: Flp family type IVb pilin [Gemmataceae bacterium]|nr:Flp family type IVb pilin [Gemmataceae bacterium]